MADAGKYRIRIKTSQMEMSGIMLVKHLEDEWRGSVVNEFGIKAFDFIIKKQKCRLLNTVSLLNKWYIRKIIESDFSFLFERAPKGERVRGKSLIFHPNGAFSIKNERQHIEYIFQPIAE
ncbi:MAG: hypothetical protein LBQ65_02530 [Tannerellaceae bacterium]|nr:hypothetical protein [Tannerellaceae bacterium]